MSTRRRPSWARRERAWRRRGRAPLGVSSGLVGVLAVGVLAAVLHVTGAAGVSTAAIGLPASSGDQVAPALAGRPAITSTVEGDARLTVEVAPPDGAAASTYEYSTDGGVTWRARADASGTVTPLAITHTSAAGVPLANGTPYPVRLRSLSAVGRGLVSNLVTGVPRAAEEPPELVYVPVRWIAGDRPQHVRIDRWGTGIRFRGGGDRDAYIDMEPTGRALLTLGGTRFRKGDGWGVTVHGGTDSGGRFEGYTVDLERGAEDRVVVRSWRGGTTDGGLLAASSVPLLAERGEEVDVTLQLDGGRLRVLVDGDEVLLVPDLPAAVLDAGGVGPGRTEGILGVRTWSSTDLRVAEAELAVG